MRFWTVLLALAPAVSFRTSLLTEGQRIRNQVDAQQRCSHRGRGKGLLEASTFAISARFREPAAVRRAGLLSLRMSTVKDVASQVMNCFSGFLCVFVCSLLRGNSSRAVRKSIGCGDPYSWLHAHRALLPSRALLGRFLTFLAMAETFSQNEGIGLFSAVTQSVLLMQGGI